MQLNEINRQTVEWLCREVFPMMVQMNQARQNLYDSFDVEYWNSKIVGYVLNQVIKIFEKKLNTKSQFFTIKLEPAEAVTLYRFLFNFPIPSEYRWKIIQRQFIIDQLHKLMNQAKNEQFNTAATA